MSDITALVSKLSGLGFNDTPVEHAPVENVEQWAEALSTVSGLPAEYTLTKTLIFKPKQPKSEAMAPVVVIAKHDSATNSKAIGNELKLKELRFANDDVLTDMFQTAKGSVSPFALANVSKENIANVRVVVDKALLNDSTGNIAFHPLTSSHTVFVSAATLQSFLKSVEGLTHQIQEFFDAGIRSLGVKNCYFPMFVSSKVLEREKDHIEGFAPEVAWVTRAGSTELAEPIAIRPTSETVMYPYFAKWIRSHRDLPLKINQWCSVVRWEFKNPQPFLRTREFLWQEGHCAYLTEKEAMVEVYDVLTLYRRIYEELLAVPVIEGVKSDKEKFAGGVATTTVEGFIAATGRGIQGATSHYLGQNFSKMFNIVVQDPEDSGADRPKLHVHQTSWGLSTRTIGVMVMTHGDDQGLVMPPRVAETQVIIIPCGLTAKHSEEDRRVVSDACLNVEARLRAVGVRAESDLREHYTPGQKFNHWEVRGVPIRVEIGPKDLEKHSVMTARRDTFVKAPVALEGLESSIQLLLVTIQNDMLVKARKTFDDRVKIVLEWNEFVPVLNSKCLALIPWCEREVCEDQIKTRSSRDSLGDEPEDEKAPSMGAKSLCLPSKQPTNPPIVHGETKCIQCGENAKRYALFGRSY
ncbi:hypothetical protein GGH94_002990 [Coemansia aciculifera]|uniref:proline--tRNA ligase n=1 Tax=Coemansia aciculifera TaxID=417176 RepID=A0A9W8M5G6_9FUNG|nr:hypothetical protein GGH94_002990 [Coemansia aciculifera]KAJ2873865.1 hypothetical protein GGH93_002875 [Coemansia aciculifera]